MKALALVLVTMFTAPAFALCFTCNGRLNDRRDVTVNGCYKSKRGEAFMTTELVFNRSGTWGGDTRKFGPEDVIVHESGESVMFTATYKKSVATIRTYFKSGTTTITMYLPARVNAEGNMVPLLDHTITTGTCKPD